MKKRITTGVAMGSMSTGFLGLTLAQSELIRHWRACCYNGQLPIREYLDPGEIRAHLAEISIIELRQDEQARFRLAGSGLRQVFGGDMRGRKLDELSQSAFEMVTLGLQRACDEQRPVGGLIEQAFKSHAWLRLPLRRNANIVQVLCHDELIPNTRLRDEYGSEFNISSQSIHNLAA